MIKDRPNTFNERPETTSPESIIVTHFATKILQNDMNILSTSVKSHAGTSFTG